MADVIPGPANVTPQTSTAQSPLGQARSMYGALSNLTPQIEAAIFGANSKVQEAGQAQQAAVTASAAAAGESARAEAEQIINIDNVHRQLLQAVGLDINDPNSALNNELHIEADARAKRNQLRTQITDLQGKSLFSDPFGYIAAIPQLNKLVPLHNQLADVENDAASEVARMQVLATNINSLTPARSADLLRTKAQTDATKIAQDAAAQAAEISARNAAGNAKMMLDTYTLERNRFADILALSSHEESIKNRQLGMEQLQLQRGIVNEDRANRVQAKADADNQETALQVGINLYRRAISGNVQAEFTKEDIKRMPTNIKQAWYEVIMRGNYGNSYADSVPFIDRFGNVAAAAQTGNAAMMSQVRSIKQRAEAAVPSIINREKAKNPLGILKPDAALEMAYNEIYQADSSVAIPGADKSAITGASPYSIDYDTAAKIAKASKDPGLIGNVLLQEKSRNPAYSLNAVMTPRSLFASVEAQVTAGTVDPKQAAAELSRFFALSTANGYQASGIKYLGLPQLTDFTITPGATGKSKVDLMNTAQVEGYLTSSVAAKRRAEHSITNERTPGFN